MSWSVHGRRELPSARQAAKLSFNSFPSAPIQAGRVSVDGSHIAVLIVCITSTPALAAGITFQLFVAEDVASRNLFQTSPHLTSTLKFRTRWTKPSISSFQRRFSSSEKSRLGIRAEAGRGAGGPTIVESPESWMERLLSLRSRIENRDVLTISFFT